MGLDKTYIIYMHKNLINNKVYIGQTNQTLTARCKNGEGYIDSPKFYNAIQKYGWNNFEHIILEKDIVSVDEADEKERYWIKYYNSIEDGYNISEGGGKHPRGKEFAKRVSEGQKENWVNNIQRKEKARQKKLKDWQNPDYRNKFLGSNNGNASKVKCIELNKIFNTVKEAAEYVKTSRQNITGACKGRQNTAAGYHWEYVINKENNNE